jgi:hypothetical protein
LAAESKKSIEKLEISEFKEVELLTINKPTGITCVDAEWIKMSRSSKRNIKEKHEVMEFDIKEKIEINPISGKQYVPFETEFLYHSHAISDINNPDVRHKTLMSINVPCIKQISNAKGVSTLKFPMIS